MAAMNRWNQRRICSTDEECTELEKKWRWNGELEDIAVIRREKADILYQLQSCRSA